MRSILRIPYATEKYSESGLLFNLDFRRMESQERRVRNNSIKPVLDWPSYQDAGMGDAYAGIPQSGGDFARAVAVCINSHQCEIQTRGVMCPSYRVLRESGFSTGGRIRLLKAALNGGLGATPFQNTGLALAMALCVGCKGCKRECENGVDMTMIKVEDLVQRLTQTRMSLRTRVLANLPRCLAFLPGCRFLLVLRNRVALLAKLTEVFFGLSARRKLPEPVAIPFLKRPVVLITPGSVLAMCVSLVVKSTDYRQLISHLHAEAIAAARPVSGFPIRVWPLPPVSEYRAPCHTGRN